MYEERTTDAVVSIKDIFPGVKKSVSIQGTHCLLADFPLLQHAPACVAGPDLCPGKVFFFSPFSLRGHWPLLKPEKHVEA